MMPPRLLLRHRSILGAPSHCAAARGIACHHHFPPRFGPPAPLGHGCRCLPNDDPSHSSSRHSQRSFGSTTRPDHSSTPTAATEVAVENTEERRDYASHGARTILEAIRQLSAPTLGSLLRHLSGGLLPQVRLVRPSTTQPQQHYPPQYYRELLALLIQEGYVQALVRHVKKTDANVNKYTLTDRGQQVLRAAPSKARILLPVTAALRQRETKEQQQRERYLQQLPQHLDPDRWSNMTTEELRRHVQWRECLEAASGDAVRIAALESLEDLLSHWRTAESTSDVSEAHVRHVAMHVATGLPGEVLSLQKLQSLLLPVPPSSSSPLKRSPRAIPSASSLDHAAVLEPLATQLADWVLQHQPALSPAELEAPMVLTQLPERPPWPYANAFSYTAKPLDLTAWQATYALYQPQPRPAEDVAPARRVAANTVRFHLFDALLHGKAVHMAHIGGAPPRRAWLQLQQAERRLHLNVTGDPATAGPHGGPLVLYDLLRPIVGDFLLDLIPKERSELDQVLLREWCHRQRWYLTLRRIGVTPQFAAVADEHESAVVPNNTLDDIDVA